MRDIPDIDCIRCDLYVEAERGFCGLIWSANGLLLEVKAATPASCIASQLNGQSFGTPDGHHPFQVISQHMQTNFCADVFKPLRQEVSRSHPHFNCPEHHPFQIVEISAHIGNNG